ADEGAPARRRDRRGGRAARDRRTAVHRRRAPQREGGAPRGGGDVRAPRARRREAGQEQGATMRLSIHIAKLVIESLRYAGSTRRASVAIVIVVGLALVALTIGAQAVAPLALYPFA